MLTRNFKTSLLAAFGAAILFSNVAFANDVEIERSAPRTVTVEQKAQFKELRAKNEASEEENVANDEQTQEKAIHLGEYHAVMARAFDGSSVTLEDGSLWSVRWGDQYKTSNWLTTDLIQITPNDNLFSIYDYYITNSTLGVSVEANLTLTPYLFGAYSHWITGIDYYAGTIILEDGSIWDIAGYDMGTISSWYLNDHVIIGTNDGLFTSAFRPYILINANTNTYANVSCTW